jgi:anti-sigma factor RsiW
MSDQCTYSQERLGAYYDGQLDAAGREEAERHLRACGACAERLAEWRGMSVLFAEAQGPRLSQIGLHRLHVNLDLMIDRGLLKLVRGLSAIAASVLLVGTLWLAHSRPVTSGESAAMASAAAKPASVVAMVLQTEESIQTASAEPGPNDWIVAELKR